MKTETSTFLYTLLDECWNGSGNRRRRGFQSTLVTQLIHYFTLAHIVLDLKYFKKQLVISGKVTELLQLYGMGDTQEDLLYKTDLVIT